MLGNSRKPGVLPVCFAALLFTFVYPCAPPGRTRKCSTTPLNPVGHIRKYSEILGNTRKCLEIPGNTRKYSETRGAACALRCTPVYPCGVPLCTPDSEMLDNIPQFVGKYAEILGNTRKCTEILGNTRKYPEILGNKGFCMCASLHPCVPLCTPVYHPEVLGNARQYPSIWWEILRNTRKCRHGTVNDLSKSDTRLLRQCYYHITYFLNSTFLILYFINNYRGKRNAGLKSRICL